LLYSHPSPIEPLNRLTEELFPRNSPNGSKALPSTKLWIKREDSNSGLAFGGNKIRKLEYVVPDAVSSGATTLVTTGGLQSNHMRQVAAAAARCGLKTRLLPNDRVKPVAPEYHKLGNIQITGLLSATHSPRDSEVNKVMKACSDDGEVPYWIPSGASTHPLGGLGYARFAFEIVFQERELNTYFDTIILPCVGGSTLGGMIAGFKLLEKTNQPPTGPNRKARKLLGIDADANAPGASEVRILGIAKNTAIKIGLSESDVQEKDVVIDERWNAGKYGFVDDQTQASIKLLARLEGILTDPVYTGKALTGVIGKARLGEFEESQNVLFVHTGGVPALSAYPDVR
ncbi:1-aminocyclopropane-1-carboxylate deaminase, partial [Lachnellula cervina]